MRPRPRAAVGSKPGWARGSSHAAFGATCVPVTAQRLDTAATIIGCEGRNPRGRRGGGRASRLLRPQSADDDPPSPGSPCSSNQLNETATTNDGTTVRCLANEENGFSWIADTGAAGTIAQLQSEGYTVTITRAGTGPLDQCKVD